MTQTHIEPTQSTGQRVDRTWCAARIHPRTFDSHKGSFGTLGIIGGHESMEGAALLAARAALLAGCGKVFVGIASTRALAVDLLQPELMLRSPDQLVTHGDELGISAWAIGCGMGRDDDAHDILSRVLAETAGMPRIMDADALYWLSRDVYLATRVGGQTIMTPHPLEAARLLGIDVEQVQADRGQAACAIAARFDTVVVLKGAGTVVAEPSGQWSLNTSGNPGLASAGTGDVLTGIIGTLLAQGMATADAARCGVWIHGAAADLLVAEGHGPIGLTASEVVLGARRIINQLAQA